MQSTLSIRRLAEDELDTYMQRSSAGHATHSAVALPTFSKPHVVSDNYGQTAVKPTGVRFQVNPLSSPARPQLVPSVVPEKKGRRAPLVVQANRALRTVLVALCGVAIVGYGLDVAASHDVSKLQDQARRLNEQNSELSAQLLSSISYQGIQENVLGRFGLHTAEHVVVVKEVAPPKLPTFKLNKHHLPVMSGY
jgi:mRNA-degrading endonuclease toxin of MazEF toxin-antitoxin module